MENLSMFLNHLSILKKQYLCNFEINNLASQLARFDRFYYNTLSHKNKPDEKRYQLRQIQ